MAGPYDIQITGGAGNTQAVSGSYTVTAQATGYDNTSILPSSVDITSSTTTLPFTIAATGELTLHVTDDGTETGGIIQGATFFRTDSEGTQYGAVITSNENGDAVFPNVPFAAVGAPNIYYIQATSDATHNKLEGIQTTTILTSAVTQQVENPLPVVQAATLTDVNYSGLPIESATVTLT